MSSPSKPPNPDVESFRESFRQTLAKRKADDLKTADLPEGAKQEVKNWHEQRLEALQVNRDAEEQKAIVNEATVTVGLRLQHAIELAKLSDKQKAEELAAEVEHKACMEKIAERFALKKLQEDELFKDETAKLEKYLAREKVELLKKRAAEDADFKDKFFDTLKIESELLMTGNLENNKVRNSLFNESETESDLSASAPKAKEVLQSVRPVGTTPLAPVQNPGSSLTQPPTIPFTVPPPVNTPSRDQLSTEQPSTPKTNKTPTSHLGIAGGSAPTARTSAIVTPSHSILNSSGKKRRLGSPVYLKETPDCSFKGDLSSPSPEPDTPSKRPRPSLPDRTSKSFGEVPQRTPSSSITAPQKTQSGRKELIHTPIKPGSQAEKTKPSSSRPDRSLYQAPKGTPSRAVSLRVQSASKKPDSPSNTGAQQQRQSMSKSTSATALPRRTSPRRPFIRSQSPSPTETLPSPVKRSKTSTLISTPAPTVTPELHFQLSSIYDSTTPPHTWTYSPSQPLYLTQTREQTVFEPITTAVNKGWIRNEWTINLLSVWGIRYSLDKALIRVKKRKSEGAGGFVWYAFAKKVDLERFLELLKESKYALGLSGILEQDIPACYV